MLLICTISAGACGPDMYTRQGIEVYLEDGAKIDIYELSAAVDIYTRMLTEREDQIEWFELDDMYSKLTLNIHKGTFGCGSVSEAGGCYTPEFLMGLQQPVNDCIASTPLVHEFNHMVKSYLYGDLSHDDFDYFGPAPSLERLITEQIIKERCL